MKEPLRPLTGRAYFVCAGHLAGILVGLLYIKGPLKPLMDSLVSPASGWFSHSVCTQCTFSMTVEAFFQDQPERQAEVILKDRWSLVRESFMW